MTRLPEADEPSPKRRATVSPGRARPQPLRGKRTSLCCFSSLTHSPFAAQRTAASHLAQPTTPNTSIHPPHRRRLHWTLTIVGCDCGFRSAAREAGRSLVTTACASARPARPPAYLHLHPEPPRDTRRTKRPRFNVCRRAVSQTPAPLFLSALARRKACLCCRGAPSHPAAISAHESHMECAIFIASERRRCHVSDTTKHIWLPRPYDWERTEQ